MAKHHPHHANGGATLTFAEVVADFKRMLRRAIAGEEWDCLLCGRPTRHRALFVPNDPQRWGARAGFACARPYALCGLHDIYDQATIERVETLLRAELGLN